VEAKGEISPNPSLQKRGIKIPLTPFTKDYYNKRRRSSVEGYFNKSVLKE